MIRGTVDHQPTEDEHNQKLKKFQTVLRNIGVLVKHASHVFSEPPLEQQAPTRKNRKEKFLGLFVHLPKSSKWLTEDFKDSQDFKDLLSEFRPFPENLERKDFLWKPVVIFSNCIKVMFITVYLQ